MMLDVVRENEKSKLIELACGERELNKNLYWRELKRLRENAEYIKNLTKFVQKAFEKQHKKT